MVTGHLSTAYLARARFPRSELVALLVASILPDLADFVLPQGNQCRTSCGLYTHAFPAILVLAALATALSWAIWHRRATALLVGCLVCVHTLFDLTTGFKPFWFGGPPIGLGLYRYQRIDFVAESLMVIAGWVALRRSKNAPRLAITYPALFALIAVQAAFDMYHRTRFGAP
ncbi:MAG: hypothetical protein ABI664_03665 [bacterium]